MKHRTCEEFLTWKVVNVIKSPYFSTLKRLIFSQHMSNINGIIFFKMKLKIKLQKHGPISCQGRLSNEEGNLQFLLNLYSCVGKENKKILLYDIRLSFCQSKWGIICLALFRGSLLSWLNNNKAIFGTHDVNSPSF